MPIDVLTGQPGNGKTALMMEMLLDASSKAERPIFAAGIDGLAPGIATELVDPRRWDECPDGSLIFVDEAWKWFGHLQDAQRQQTPPHVLKLAEHRHRGIDFVWTTQMPNQLFPFVRGLINKHFHVVRRFGTQIIDVYQWGELNEDIKSTGKRDIALRNTRALPKVVFDKYKSATLHTIKRSIPMRVWLLPVCIVAFFVLAYVGYRMLRPEAMAAKMTGEDASAPQGALRPGAASSRPDSEGPKWATLTDYAVAHMPRFPTMPWSAPIYDSRAVTADPELFCMLSGAGEDANGDYKDETCNCKTEQGTAYKVTQAECRTVALGGVPYNPYRERRSERFERGEGTSPSMARSAAPAPEAASVIANANAARGVEQYGTFRNQAPSADQAFEGHF